MTALPPTILDAEVTLTWGAAGQYYGYCTRADVEFEFTNIDNMKNKAAPPSVVAQMISYAAINSIQPLLALYYEMPYSGTDETVAGLLREINAKQAMSMVTERYMAANDAASTAGKIAGARAAFLLEDIINGHIHLEPPFGDAVPMPDMVVYPRASLITASPNPTLHQSQQPVFRMGRSHFRRRMAF